MFRTLITLVQPPGIGEKTSTLKIKRTFSGRVSIGTWLVGVTFFNFFYEATLRASLLAVRYEKTLDTIKGCSLLN